MENFITVYIKIDGIEYVSKTFLLPDNEELSLREVDRVHQHLRMLVKEKSYDKI